MTYLLKNYCCLTTKFLTSTNSFILLFECIVGNLCMCLKHIIKITALVLTVWFAFWTSKSYNEHLKSYIEVSLAWCVCDSLEWRSVTDQYQWHVYSLKFSLYSEGVLVVTTILKFRQTWLMHQYAWECGMKWFGWKLISVMFDISNFKKIS